MKKSKYVADELKAEQLVGVLAKNWEEVRREKWSVVDYVREEVKRQGYDVAEPEGIRRVAWMLEAWAMACNFSSSSLPSLDDAITLARIIEPAKNEGGLRRVGVVIRESRSGVIRRTFPTADELPRLLSLLFGERERLTPVEFYKEFELIHPFVDGNGRVGKILLNWLSGTLLVPYFPPNDLFGDPIRNP